MNATSSPAVTQVLSFLESIGIPTTARPGAKGFIDGIAIVEGSLHYDPAVVRSSDLLHEAGHLAVIPSEYRKRANGDLDGLFDFMFQDAQRRFDIDSPEMRTVIQAGECEASAWAYAAGVAIGLEPDDIIHPDDYDREGASVRLQLSCNAHFGINGLRHGGMIHSVRSYPAMLRWTQI